MSKLKRTAAWAPIVAGCLLASQVAPQAEATESTGAAGAAQAAGAATAAETGKAAQRAKAPQRSGRSTRASASPAYEVRLLRARVPGTTGDWNSSAAGMSSTGLVVGVAQGTVDGQWRSGVFVADRAGVRRWVEAPSGSGCTLDGGVDVNRAGAVLGTATCGQEFRIPVIVDARGTMRRLPVPTGLSGLPEALNDRGDAIGKAVSNDRGSSIRKRTYWPARGGMVVHDATTDQGDAWGISNTGVVVGNAHGRAAWSRASAALDRTVSTPSSVAYGGGISADGRHVVANRGGESVLLRWRKAERALVAPAARFQAERVNDSGRVLGRLLDAGYGPGIVARGVLYDLKDITRGVPSDSVLSHRDLAGNGDIAVDVVATDYSTTQAALLVARR